MKKIVYVFLFCFFILNAYLPVFSMNFTENYPENCVCFAKIDSKDLLAKILMIDLESNKLFPTYLKKIDKIFKSKKGISILNDVESVGIMVLNYSTEEKPDFKLCGFINGKFESKDTLQIVKEMLANPSNMAQTPMTLSSGKNPKLSSDKVTIIHKDKKTLLFSNDNELLDSITNKTLKMKSAPESLQVLLKQNISFLNLDPSSFMSQISKSAPPEAMNTIKSIKTLQAFFKDDNFNLKLSFDDQNVANSIFQMLNMLRSTFFDYADKTIAENEKMLSESSLADFFSKAQQTLSLCKYKDFLNDLTLKTDDKDLMLTAPVGKETTALFVTGVVGVMSAMAVPNFKASRDQARKKACLSNMRVLNGAVEMYNMDMTQMMTTLDIEKLVKNKYLKMAPKCPESDKSDYYSTGDLTQNGEIACPIHGTVDNPKN